MPTLSKHYALVDFDPGNPTSVLVEPISATVTVDETWSPSIRATVVVPTASLPYDPDPRYPLFLGLRLQQDFGDLIYAYEFTNDYTPVTVSSLTAAHTPVEVSAFTRDYAQPWNIFESSLPLSTVTTAYTPVTPLKLTNAGFTEVWRMSDYLHTSGTFNPADSTVFDSYLMLRSVQKDYVTGETTLELMSSEAILHDSIGYPTDFYFNFEDLRSIINYVLNETFGAGTQLQPGTANKTYSPAYTFVWKPNQSAWDILYALVNAAGLVLYADEHGDFYLVTAGAVSGDLYLKDDDNITMLSSKIDRNSKNFFDYAIVEYVTTGGIVTYDSFGISGFDISKDFYYKAEDMNYPGSGAAQALVLRGMTRGQVYNVEAISNYNTRPRQTMTIDVTGEPTKTAIIQSVTWSLPSDRMTVNIRDLQEVI